MALSALSARPMQEVQQSLQPLVLSILRRIVRGMVRALPTRRCAAWAPVAAVTPRPSPLQMPGARSRRSRHRPCGPPAQRPWNTMVDRFSVPKRVLVEKRVLQNLRVHSTNYIAVIALLSSLVLCVRRRPAAAGAGRSFADISRLRHRPGPRYGRSCAPAPSPRVMRDAPQPVQPAPHAGAAARGGALVLPSIHVRWPSRGWRGHCRRRRRRPHADSRRRKMPLIVAGKVVTPRHKHLAAVAGACFHRVAPARSIIR